MTRAGAVTPAGRARVLGDPFDAEARDAYQKRGLTDQAEREAAARDIAALRRDGFLVLDGAVAADSVAAVCAELDELNRHAAWGSTDFEGFRTKRVYNLMAKARSVDSLCAHRRVLAIIEGYLESQIQLTAATGITIFPGENSQGLHRDDAVYPLPRPHPPLMVSTIWAIDAHRPGNGGTELIPRTHRAEEGSTPTDEALRIEMPAGSVLLFDGGLWHGGGANTSTDARRAISLSYNCAWLRQQENAYLSVPLELVRTLGRPLQCLLGYTTASIMLGQVERRNPIHWFDEGA